MVRIGLKNMIRVETFPAGPLGCNCSIVFDSVGKSAIVVDPGGDFELIEKKLDALEAASITAIVHTHTHIDHVGATADVLRKSRDKGGNARACIHEQDRFLYDLLPVQAAMLGIPLPEKVEMEGSLNDGSSIHSGAIELGILHTPGHTPGSVVFLVKDDSDKTLVFSGDTLFRRGIGRTDLWGGDSDLIIQSLKQKILTLPDDAIVIPGHGPNTTIVEERTKNPFLAR
jgi:hydroxyacylglutathione hydrolase